MSLNVSILKSYFVSIPMQTNRIDSMEILILYLITFVGIVVNLLTMICLLIIPSYRIKSSCFLFHHCLICLTLSLLIYPYSLSFTRKGIRCDYLGNLQVTCVTAQLLNMAAMVASEAYRFEDLIHQENSHRNRRNSGEKKEKEKRIDQIQMIDSTSTRREKEKEEVDHHYFEYEYEQQTNQSTISCGCLSFGILIIWFSSIILHLGKFIFKSIHFDEICSS